MDEVCADLDKIVEISSEIGLQLNMRKCEMCVFGGQEDIRVFSMGAMKLRYPGFRNVPIDEFELLESAVSEGAVQRVVSEKILMLKTMVSRLVLPSHQALYLLRNCLAVPKIMYVLRTSLIYKFPTLLRQFDELVRTSLPVICNVKRNDVAWIQSSLPVRDGGSGKRRIEMLAPSAYLASAFATASLISKIIQTEMTTFI